MYEVSCQHSNAYLDLSVLLTKFIACGDQMLKPREFGYATLIMEGGAVAIIVQKQLLRVYLEF